MTIRIVPAGLLCLMLAANSSAADTYDIERLGWLAGEWIGEGREGDEGEIQGIARQYWSPPLEGTVSYLFTWHYASTEHVHYAITVFDQAEADIVGKGIHYGRDFETFEENPWQLAVAEITSTSVGFRCTKYCRSETVTFSLREDGTMEERWHLNPDENKPDWIVVYRRPGSSRLSTGDAESALDTALREVALTRNAGDLDKAQELLAPMIDADVDQIPVSLEQARIYATQGDDEEALRWLGKTLNLGGNTAWPAVRDEKIFASIKSHEKYAALEKRMQPCTGGQFEQLSYIAGNWQVTSRANPHGPKEYFDVEESIDGCAYVAVYGTMAGYKYTSLIFYDRNTDTWHQRGVDNQGFPMQMEGKIEGDELVLRYLEGEYLYKSVFREVSASVMHNEIHRSGDNGETWNNFFRGEFVRAN